MKKLFKSAVIYLGGNVLSRLVIFFMLPLYTVYIPPADYGYYDVVNTYMYLAISLVFMEIWVIILRFMFDNKEDDKYKPMSNGLVLYFFFILVITTLVLIANFFFDIRYVGWVLAYVFFQTLSLLYGYLARGFAKSLTYAVSGVISAIINAFTNVVLIFVFSVDYKALYISYVAGALIQCAIIELKVGVLRQFKWRAVSLNEMKKMFLFAAPFGISSTAYWFLGSFNRAVITAKLSVSDNGIYSVAAKFTLVLTLLSSTFILAWQELAFKKGSELEGNENKLSEFYSDAGNVFLKLIGTSVLFLMPIIYVIFPIIVDKQYEEGFYIIPLAIIATMVNVYVSFLTSIFTAIKRTKLLFLDAICGSIVNIIVVFSLIELIGINAASIALICGWGTSALIRILLLKKYINYKVELRSLVFLLPLIIIGSFTYLHNSLQVNIIWLFMVCIISIFIFRKEVNMIYSSIKRANIAKKQKINKTTEM